MLFFLGSACYLQNVATVWLLHLLAIWPIDDGNIIITEMKSVIIVI
jgi:hypothetical protein